MENKAFGGFTLQSTNVQSSTDREDIKKNDDPEL